MLDAGSLPAPWLKCVSKAQRSAEQLAEVSRATNRHQTKSASDLRLNVHIHIHIHIPKLSVKFSVQVYLIYYMLEP